MLKMLSSLHVDFFAINCFIKKTQVQQSLLHLQHTGHQLSLEGFNNCVAVLAIDFNTPGSWAGRFSDFLSICSILAPISSNSSVSIRRLCFCFLSIKSSVVISLFTKLWIICLLETFHHEIYVEIFADNSSRSLFHTGVIRKYTLL
jgi:hypothetical protein